jgi:hypothetical protein
MFSGKELDRRASFGLSVQFGVCFFSSEIPVRPVRLRQKPAAEQPVDILAQFLRAGLHESNQIALKTMMAALNKLAATSGGM